MEIVLNDFILHFQILNIICDLVFLLLFRFIPIIP